MDKRKWYVEPVWSENFMMLSAETNRRWYWVEVDRQFGHVKHVLLPLARIAIQAGTLFDTIKWVEMRAMAEDSQLVMCVTYGKGNVLLGDVRPEVVPQMEQWAKDVNDLFEDVRRRQQAAPNKA